MSDVNCKKTSAANDFPVNAEGKKIKKQDGTSIANTDDPAGDTPRLHSGAANG
jgi:hypothetical protein